VYVYVLLTTGLIFLFLAHARHLTVVVADTVSGATYLVDAIVGSAPFVVQRIKLPAVRGLAVTEMVDVKSEDAGVRDGASVVEAPSSNDRRMATIVV
jgi:hypothetical protein